MSKKVEESDMCVAKSRQTSAKKQQQDRFAFTDITNDSPIAGVAMGNLETPKKRPNSQAHYTGTPGSGEVLLRGQVKTLLQKVEEEGEFLKKTTENKPFFNNLQGFVNSPCISLAPPTTASTPQVLNFSNGLLSAAISTPVFLIPQMIGEISYEKKQEGVESDNGITRSLLLDFSKKSESSDSSKCYSGLTYQGHICESSIKKPFTDDDDHSPIWSIQANASCTREYEEEEEEEEEDDQEPVGDDFEEDEEYDYGDNDDGHVDDICEGISKISIRGTTEFTGKHIRFVYNSDGDEEYTEVIDE